MSEYLTTVFDKFELRVRMGYHYSEDDIWAKVEKIGIRLGVTDYLQRTSGDMAFVELVKRGLTVERKAELGTLETAKTTVSLLSPTSGTVEEVNTALAQKPELVNMDPYGEGWLVVLSPHRFDEDLNTLMSAGEYFEMMLKKLKTEHQRLESG